MARNGFIGVLRFSVRRTKTMLRWLMPGYLQAHAEAHPHSWWLLTVVAIALAYFHSHKPRTDFNDRAVMVLFAFCGAAIIILLAFDTNQHVPFEQMIAVTCVYGSGLYAILFSALRARAARLTRTRGEKWIKEMDYPYLLLGAVGLMLSINKLDVVSDRMNSD
jgi:hypothetical protein